MTVDAQAPDPAPNETFVDEADAAQAHAANGMALLADSRFGEALAVLRRAVALGDRKPSTHLNLAIAKDRTGDRVGARSLMRLVATQLPEWDEPVLRIAESLRADNDLAAAEAAYREVLELQPTRPTALIALGGLLLSRGAALEARDLLLRCCGVAPDNAEAWDTLGLALRATGAPSLALSAFVRAQHLRPDELSYLLHGVDVAVQAKQAEVELVRLDVACDRDPLNASLQVGRGMLLERLGQRDAAIDALEAATVLAPDAPAPLALFSGLLARSTRLRHAEAALRRLRGLQPANPQADNDHAAVLMQLHRHAEARTILLNVLEQFGPKASVLCNLASTTVCLGLQDEAVAAARQAIALDPVASLPRRTLCNVLPYHQDTTPDTLLTALRAAAAALPRSAQPDFRNTRQADRKLVLGLLSGSFRSHPVGWLTVAGFENLDPDGFEVVCLTQNTMLDDPITGRFRAVARDWVEVNAMSDTALVDTARAHAVDVLIDLGGYGDSGRMVACAHRLAPVQIKWVGMQNHSTGLPEIDWFITDRWETPEGFERLYTERLLRLPDGYVCYSPPPYAPDVGPLPALTNGHVTFGCFNNLAKVTPQVIETWSVILRRVPNAHLVLKTHQFGDAATAERVLAGFTAGGIEPERIELRGSSGHRRFMGEYSGIDIVLDPFPYSGGLTTCEALWMGVPTITLPTGLFAARHSASHLSNAGLEDWLTSSVKSYVAMAVERAADLPALAELRSGLRERMRRSPLCDAPRFGRNLGAALRQTWQAWCEDPR